MTLFLSFSPHFQGFLSTTLFHPNFKGQKFQNPNSKKILTLKNSKKLNLKYQGWFFQIPDWRKSSKRLQKRSQNSYFREFYEFWILEFALEERELRAMNQPCIIVHHQTAKTIIIHSKLLTQCFFILSRILNHFQYQTYFIHYFNES